MTEGKRNLIQGLLQEYDIQSADDIQEALKDILSGTIRDMLEAEYKGYQNLDHDCYIFTITYTLRFSKHGPDSGIHYETVKSCIWYIDVLF